MSTIQAIAFQRLKLADVRSQFPELSQAGIYLLLGTDENNPDQKVAYIGESERVAERLQYYAGNLQARESKGFWRDTVVLVSKDESLTKSHVRYVEARLIAAAQKNPHWNLRNTQRANEAGKLPQRDSRTMDDFFRQTTILVRALGHDIFKPLAGSGRLDSEPRLTDSKAVKATFAYAGDGFSAKMAVMSDASLVVLAGSTARLKETKTIPNGVVALRHDLRAKGTMVNAGEMLKFSTDCQFPSVTAAAATVYGGSVNGRTAWRLADSRVYAEWEESQQSGLPDAGVTDKPAGA